MIRPVNASDTNRTLIEIQDRLRPILVTSFFLHARCQYLHAVRLGGIEDDLASKVSQKAIGGFITNTFRSTYDVIAAFYRLAHDDGGQIPFMAEGETYENLLETRWCEFFAAELSILVESSALVHFVLAAFLLDERRPYAPRAEAQLVQLLKERYGPKLRQLQASREEKNGPRT